jgi:hypothetical protein
LAKFGAFLTTPKSCLTLSISLAGASVFSSQSLKLCIFFSPFYLAAKARVLD